MRYIPTSGRIIAFQEKATKVGSIFLSTDAQTTSTIAEIKCVAANSKFSVGQKVFYDRSAGSIISDTDDGIWVVLEENEVLAIVEEE